MTEEILRVGMAEIKVAKAPGKISTLGLGSCIGICGYDAAVKVGGIVHIMLPSSSLAMETPNPAKYADTGIPLLMSQMEKLGATKNQIIIKIIGGAEMFIIGGKEDHLAVGERNIHAVEETCHKMNIPITAKSVGGHAGKSVTLDLETGNVEIRSMSETTLL